MITKSFKIKYLTLEDIREGNLLKKGVFVCVCYEKSGNKLTLYRFVVNNPNGAFTVSGYRESDFFIDITELRRSEFIEINFSHLEEEGIYLVKTNWTHELQVNMGKVLRGNCECSIFRLK